MLRKKIINTTGIIVDQTMIDKDLYNEARSYHIYIFCSVATSFPHGKVGI